VVGGVCAVFHEERARYDNFIAGVADGLENCIQSSRRSCRHDNVRAVNRHVMLFRGFARQGLPHIGVAGVGHIAVRTFFVFFRHVQKNPVKSRRRLNVGIPQRIIKHLVRAMLFP